MATGTQYLNYPLNQRKYSHMRAMLFKLWRIKYGHEGLPFSPDQKFMQDPVAITSYILEYFNTYEIDRAHNLAIQDLQDRGRGRPKGALNKSRFFQDKTIKAMSNIMEEYTPSDDAMDARAIKMSDEELLDELKDSTPKSESIPNVDMSKFALKSDLNLTNSAFLKFTGAQDRINSQIDNRLENIRSAINNITENKPNIITLERRELPKLDLGIQHKHFEKLLRRCYAALRSGHHLNIWVYGPAGCGKSTAAEIIAKALGLDFYTNGKLATDFQVLGYNDAYGKYVTTQFRQAFENGGIYLGDEIDGSMPDALLAFNGALANGICAFPDKIVKRHKDFIFIGAANTIGTGATIEYSGRMKQDAAFLNRFVQLYWPLDEALEDSLCADKEWLKRVRHVRARVAQVGIKGVMITPRAAIYGESLLAAGCDIDDTEEATLKQGLTENQWNMVKPTFGYTAPVQTQDVQEAAQ
jgi:hypothetical protein